MKKLSPEEAKAIKLSARGNLSPVYRAVMDMMAGESLLIERVDWNRQSPPSVMLRQIMREHGRDYTIARTADGTGWVITRVG